MKCNTIATTLSIVATFVGGIVPIGFAQAPIAEMKVDKQAEQLVERGAKFLLERQAADGSWFARGGPGITALCGRALLASARVDEQHPAAQRARKYLLHARRSDGGFYAAEGLLKNYETSVAVSFLANFSDAESKAIVKEAVAFLKEGQWDETESIDPKNSWYGGAGYGKHKRPDLSNTQIMLDALKDSGLAKDDPAYQKALVFIQRCQMLAEQNDQSFANGSNQGGFIYTAANDGESKAGTIEHADGRVELRAYGSMTYAGLKSMLYAGLTKDDPRVQAAVDWIRSNWTLERNPGMPLQQAEEGLYYYYQTFGRALAALDVAEITDKQGRKHDWRAELVAKFAETQNDDGSWTNEKDRWMEGIPELTTAYALIAMDAVFE